MSQISITNISDGTQIDAADVNTPLNTIVDDYNGNIDSTNLADNAVTTSKITDANVTAAKLATNASTMNDGWISTTDTWTYASASTFTVPGDQTAKYTAGTRLMWTQTTVKYGVAVSSSYSAPNTTVSIAVNADYTIANAAITANYYSYAANPQGYPGVFNYTPSLTASVSNPALGSSTIVGKFSVTGKLVTCFGKYSVTTGGAFNAGNGTYRVSVPINASTTSPTMQGNGTLFDTGTEDFVCRSTIGASTYILFGLAKNGAGVSHNSPIATFATGDYLSWTITYEMA